MESGQAIKALAALAQDTRLRVYRLLVEKGPAGASPGWIAQALDVPASSLSFHLKELALANMVTARPEGRSIVYAANFPAMNALVGYLTENCCGGNPCTPASVRVRKRAPSP